MTRKTARIARAEGQVSARKTPRALATPFPPWKRKPDREAVAEDSGDSGGDGQVVVAVSKVLSDGDGGVGFAEIEQKGSDAEPFGSGAGDVGCADVAASEGADVLFFEDADEQIPERDGA